MKRDSCIETIKNQINAKISAKIISEQDYIVFRPKTSLFNPVVNQLNNKNMTSIFQLENKRKNQSAFMKFRFDQNIKSYQYEAIQNNIKIQKCQSSKKFILKNQKQKNFQKRFYLGTLRQKMIKTSSEKIGRIKNTGSLRKERKEMHQILFGLQRQKNCQSVLQNSKNSMLIQQKENLPKALIFNRLKRIPKDQEAIDKSYLSFFKEKQKEIEGLKIKNHRFKESHKRMITEIPPFLHPKYTDKVQSKNVKNYFKNLNEGKNRKILNLKEEFLPWQTSQLNESHEQILHQ